MSDLTFALSPRSTVGVEWEMQVIDSRTGELRQGVPALEAALESDGAPHPLLNHEIIQSTLEVTSNKRDTIAECVDDIRGVMDELRAPLAELGATLVASGTHPTGEPAEQAATQTAHYDELIDMAQYWARRILTCGLHIHVGIEDAEKVQPISSAILTNLGELQALGANSPFWRGEDTGYAAFRPTIFHQLPTAGMPPQFDDWHDFSAAVKQLVAAGYIESAHNLFWDLRPAPHLGTLEVRIFDAAASLTEVARLSAVAHCLVEHYSTLLDEGETLPRHPDWIVQRNSFASSRYGVEADVAEPDGDGARLIPVRDRLARLFEDLEPTARKLDCANELRGAWSMVENPGYARQREAAGAALNFDAVIGYLTAEMARGLSESSALDHG